MNQNLPYKKGYFFIALLIASTVAASCGSSSQSVSEAQTLPAASLTPIHELTPPNPDPRVGLKAGLFDAEEAIWNMTLLSTTPPPANFLGVTNSDLAFKDNYAIQGNYNGFMVWDISNPAAPSLVIDYLCPASQSDVSVYENLLFVSGEGFSGRLDCGTEGVQEAVSHDRLRGIRIFDITDITAPEYVGNVQTCRGSHTHSVLKHPADDENVYVYVSGSAPVRPEDELQGCSAALPDEDPNSALFRIEVIQVPLANPAQAHIVNSPRIFEDLEAPPTHGLSPADRVELEKAKAEGAFVAHIWGQERVLPSGFARQLLAAVVAERGGTGDPTAADSSLLRETLTERLTAMFGQPNEDEQVRRGPNQCHDITLYPEIGLAGGACEGYGILLDITNPASPFRVDAVADSNFAYWHSATFNNDGTKVLFTDEWGGGGQPKCRELDPMEWGANAIFELKNNKMEFKSYYKLPAAQTPFENCVAHNGSLIPIPGRDVMVQAWYQGGISVFDWTDAENPVEIAFHDRGPVDSTQFQMAGSWSVYWYNGAIVSSEISRGLDIFELQPSEYLTANEIAAANTVTLNYLNAQGQPQYIWPASFALARAYVDQLDRNKSLSADEIAGYRSSLNEAEKASGNKRVELLTALSEKVKKSSPNAGADTAKMQSLAETLRELAS